MAQIGFRPQCVCITETLINAVRASGGTIRKAFSKYKLSLAFSKWLAVSGVGALQEAEREAWGKLFLAVNKSLK